MSDLISRQQAIDAVNGLIDMFEQILRDIREANVDDSVCGMCEYDGAYIGQSGDWCNECPGFDKDDCFKLSDKTRKKWTEEIIKALPPIQPEPHWIPCSAELPKTNDPVNVTYVNHNPGNYYAEVKDKPYTATAHFHKGQWYWYSCTTQDLLNEYGTWIPDLIDKDVEILAWMPLPEPYKGVTE